MNLTLCGHDDRYAIEQLQMSLFGDSLDGAACSRLYRSGTYLTAVTTIEINGKKSRGVRRMKAADETVRLRRQILQQSYYRAALAHLPAPPPWGALAGVRPTKISTRHLLEGGTEASAKKLLKSTYYVTDSRIDLALDCSRSTVRAACVSGKEHISLYIGIPFCPTRCTYCSFVSRSIGKRTDLMDSYLEALYQEMELTGKLLASSGRYIRTIYIGGGTPTTLTKEQMQTLLTHVRECFDLSQCIEFTVEGGRPDTLNAEKLQVIREGGADRMSINPQSMEAHVLRACGRPHTPEDLIARYREAEAAGYTAINMDLIAGLPEDSLEGFCRSVDAVTALRPANITVHTLALKKDADLFQRREHLPDGEEVSQMVEYANRTLRQLGYRPYYLYRQKYMSGSFENVGWSREGLDCLYNIYMMEELHTIVSLGGGGMNKVNLPDGSLQRFHNPKFPEQYIQQIDAVLSQKRELFALLQKGDQSWTP